MSRQIFQSPLFERKKKRLTKAEITVLDEVARRICETPEIGEAKKGDIKGSHLRIAHNINVYKNINKKIKTIYYR